MLLGGILPVQILQLEGRWQCITWFLENLEFGVT